MCEFYDTAVARFCREPVAEEVHEKERANFCDYFVASPAAYVASDSAPAKQAQRDLERLFGDESGADPASDEDAARRQLERLFGNDGET